MDTPEQREELTRLISRLLDEDLLSSEERSQLNATLLADPEARRIYMQYIDMQLEFACLVEPEIISETRLADAVKSNLIPLTEATKAEHAAKAEAESQWARDAVASPRRRWPEFAAAAAAAILIIGFAIKNVQRPASYPAIGLVENATGEVQFGDPGEVSEAASPGIEVNANQTLVTKGKRVPPSSSSRTATSLVVAGDTQITTRNGAKRIEVSGGAVAASVSPQPVGKPLIVSTPIAAIEVVGTRFSVNHYSDLTDLAVTQGVVVLTRHSDGSSIRVPAGRRVFAEAGGRLRLDELPSLSSSWRADFEDRQLHPACQIGEPTEDGLPDQSKGAVRATRVEESDQPGAFTEQVAFGTPWAEGLVLAREKTHLHLRYKMEKPGPLQVQIETRTDGPKPQLANYQFDQFAASSAGQWIEASVPLKQFRNPADGEDHTMAGEIPLTLLIVAPVDHTGLVIDEVRLDGSGSGEFGSSPVE